MKPFPLIFSTALFTLLLMFGTGSARADGVALVKDLNTAAVGLEPEELVTVGSQVFFKGRSGATTFALWKSSGTTGTLIKLLDQEPFYLTAFNGKLYFRAYDAAHGSELWVSDGTVAGTTVLDIVPGTQGSNPADLTVLNGKLYFSAFSPTSGNEPWVSDGTLAGTTILKDIEPGDYGSFPANFAATSNHIFFVARTFANGREPYASNGSVGNAQLLGDLASGPDDSGAYNFVTAGNLAYFIDFNDDTLWRSDGTPGGTFQLQAAQVNSSSQLTAVGSTLYFFSYSPGYALWKSDGTDIGTTQIKAIPATPDLATSHAGALFFTLPGAGATTELWSSDGTPGGTVKGADISADLGSCSDTLFSHNGQLLFNAYDSTHGCELWHSNGTTAGTGLVSDINIGAADSFPYAMTALNSSEVLFSADSGPDGIGLWKVNTSTLNTTLVDNTIVATQGTYQECELPYDGKCLFFTENGSTQHDIVISDGTPGVTTKLVSTTFPAGIAGIAPLAPGDKYLLRVSTNDAGSELWISDGTPAGTALLKDINPGPFGSNPSGFVREGSNAYFTAYDGAVNGVFRSDGTAGGTIRLTPADFESSYYLASSLASTPSGVLFITQDDSIPPAGQSYPLTLWYSNGTGGSAAPLKVLHDGVVAGVPASGDADVWVDSITSVAGRMFASICTEISDLVYDPILDVFVTVTLSEKCDLWTSDGTPAGTTKIFSAANGASMDVLAKLGSKFVVFVNSWSNLLSEIYSTDGTAAGTAKISSIPSEQNNFAYYGFDDWTTPLAYKVATIGNLLYFTATDSTHGKELWRTDGTAAGTFMVKDINPGTPSSSTENKSGINFFSENQGFAVVDSLLYFFGQQTEWGVEMWRTDGTNAGTFKAVPIGTSGPSQLRNLTSHQGKLYFSATDSAHGRELWSSDGTPAGTSLYADIFPGPSYSDPILFTSTGANLFFLANDGMHGLEPWVSSSSIIDSCPADPSKTSPGICGCGTPDLDSDQDGTLNCQDPCADNPAKTAPGVCGCGALDIDANSNGVIDCVDTGTPPDLLAPIKERIAKAIALVGPAKKTIKSGSDKKIKAANAKIKAARKELTNLLKELATLIPALPAGIASANISVANVTATQKALKKATGKKTPAKDAKKAWGLVSSTLKKMV